MTPAVAGQVLSKGDDGAPALEPKAVTKYQSGTAICMFKMQWSRPDIFNATHDCARHMSDSYPSHQQALDHFMKYVIGTKNRGLVLSPTRIWNGNKDFEFRIHGRSDSDYATNKDDRKSIFGGRVFLKECQVIF